MLGHENHGGDALHTGGLTCVTVKKLLIVSFWVNLLCARSIENCAAPVGLH